MKHHHWAAALAKCELRKEEGLGPGAFMREKISAIKMECCQCGTALFERSGHTFAFGAQVVREVLRQYQDEDRRAAPYGPKEGVTVHCEWMLEELVCEGGLSPCFVLE